ncbi:hypothetical protein PG997_010763 [Apiospora hydei]|uniref:Phytanoyl-CoA dioxygenase n=1 Tax=Apiospora hydei TaxID=1337664 RepID=A0ABR1VH76_9PEZI
MAIDPLPTPPPEAKPGSGNLIPKPSGPNKLFAQPDQHFNDFRDDILRDGYAVIKGAVPRARADAYAESMWTYLETFKNSGRGLGFRRDDPSTYTEPHLPVINEKGMCSGYGVNHEDFAWSIREEPGVVDAFAQVFDTDDLLVSFDAVNMALPGRKDLPANKPWPHQDQDPAKPEFRCLQGIVNLLPNGPDDGGLIVCRGAHLLSEQFHREFAAHEKDPVFRWTTEWYGFSDAGLKWLEDQRDGQGRCEWVKIECEPGDLLVWDSRTPHYNLSPSGDRARFATYTCYMPAADASQADLVRKKAAFEQTLGTTHWPNAVHVRDHNTPLKRQDGTTCPYSADNSPRRPVRLTERGFKLTGIPYIATATT